MEGLEFRRRGAAYEIRRWGETRLARAEVTEAISQVDPLSLSSQRGALHDEYDALADRVFTVIRHERSSQGQ
jgi:hypothetical protein